MINANELQNGQRVTLRLHGRLVEAAYLDSSEERRFAGRDRAIFITERESRPGKRVIENVWVPRSAIVPNGDVFEVDTTSIVTSYYFETDDIACVRERFAEYNKILHPEAHS